MRASLLLLVGCIAAVGTAQAPLPTLNPHTTTTTGISAGAAFAVQYQFAFSSTIHAAGIIAGLPYYCAQGEMAYAFECMDSPYLINLGTLLADVNYLATTGKIDPVSNLAKQRIMLFSGTQDSIVNPLAMKMLASMYQQLNATHVTTYFNYSAEHAWITNYYGNACDYKGSPYINNCGLDFAGAFLKDAFAGMGLAWNATRGVYNPGNMRTWDISSFGASSSISLASTAYIYVPAQCAPGGAKAGRCHLHINFHGCTQSASNFFLDPTKYVAHTGLNEWAESNDVVVFYPQNEANPLLENPEGCFDWWGYAGANYPTKEGAQMAVIRAAAQSLVGGQ